MEIIYFIYKFISILHRKCLLFSKLREHPSGVDVGSDESGSYVMVYSIEEVSHGHVHMGNGGFQSGILMARIPISDTRNYCGGDKKNKYMGKELGIHRGGHGWGQSKRK